MASMTTPFGFSQSGSMTGQFNAGAQNLAFGCELFVPCPGFHGLPCQSVTSMPVRSTSFSSPSKIYKKIIKLHDAKAMLKLM